MESGIADMPIASGVPAKLIIYQNNTQDIDLFGLMDTNGNFMNAAVITAVILDGNRDVVLSAIQMNYVLGSNGNYVGIVPASFAPAIGTEYVLVLDGDQAASHLHIEIPVEVRVRNS